MVIPLIPVFVAQVTPDLSLGVEQSIVTQDVEVGGELADRVDGGAIRGENLFHSFSEFNINEGQRVYFGNPLAVDHIFSRVTGANPSNLFGTLGVDGPADLFFMNPNGMLFGENASLDIEGSFVGTTANSFKFADGSEYDASPAPGGSLLTVSVPLGLQYGPTPSNSTITNRGTLRTGQDFELRGNRLNLEGQLFSGGNLTLLGTDSVQIRDAVDNPFVAASLGEMVVQGDRLVDVFALSHPDSGLYSGEDMVLRSSNPVGGDAYYWSGGSFRIEDLDGKLGDFYSPYDPVIRVLGDLQLANYVGNSIHILAGGFIVIPGSVMVIATDDFPAALRETITLSDGTTVEIDGSIRPTVDIRAGVDPALVDVRGGFEQIGNGSFPGGGTFFQDPTSANIIIGTIIVDPPNGSVLLTNQYHPNPNLLNRDILITGEGVGRLGNIRTVQGIDARGIGGNGSSVFLDAGNRIILPQNASINTSAEMNIAGDIRLIAENNILVASSISSFSFNGTGGNVDILSGSEILLDVFSEILSGRGGDINISSKILNMRALSQISSPTVGNVDGGNIQITATEAILSSGGLIGTFTLSPETSGHAGNITINTKDLEVIGIAIPIATVPGGFQTGGDITTETMGIGDAGDILIEASQVRLVDGGQIRASNLRQSEIGGSGRAGNITIRASDFVEVTGIILDSDDPSKIATTVNAGATGEGGDLLIETERLIVSNGAQVQAGAFGIGNGGSITLHANQSIDIFDEIADGNPTGLFTGPEGPNATGNGGDLIIKTGTLNITGEDSRINNEVDSNSQGGNAGETYIEVDTLNINEGARITTGTFSIGQGGSLTIDSSESITISGTGGVGSGEEPSSIFSATIGIANGGDISIRTGKLSIQNGGTIAASTFGLAENNLNPGRAGNIKINVTEEIELTGQSRNNLFASSIVSETGRLFGFVNRGAMGDGGDIFISAPILNISDNAEISTATLGRGNAGNIMITGDELVISDRAEISSRSIAERTTIPTSARAGDITIAIADSLHLTDSDISTESIDFTGGDIHITANTMQLRGDGDITTNVQRGQDGGGDITLTANLIIALDDSDIISSAPGGEGGNITLNTPAFFGENLQINAPGETDLNNRADINATGAIDGIITTPDVSFVQNSLNTLPDTLVNPESLIVNSCVIHSQDGRGTFLVTGAGGLLDQPGNGGIATYATGEIQTLSSHNTSAQTTDINAANTSGAPSWQPGQPIVEPQDIYQLPDGRLVMSHTCEE